MNRSEMVEKAARLLADYDGLSTPDETDDARARIVLNAILPQVTTVAELEALPHLSVVLDSEGEPWTRWLNGWTKDATSEQLSHVGPLTVVWTPTTGSEQA